MHTHLHVWLRRAWGSHSIAILGVSRGLELKSQAAIFLCVVFRRIQAKSNCSCVSQLSLDTGPLSSKGSQAFTSPVLFFFPQSSQHPVTRGCIWVRFSEDGAGRLPSCVTWGSHYITARVIWCPSWPAFRWPSLASSWRWWPYSSNNLYPIYRTAVASGTTCHISGIGFFKKKKK